jgi:hypothetical protein
MQILRFFLCWITLFFIIASPAFTQHYIYLKKESRQGKVLEINANNLTYQPAHTASTQNILPTRDVLLLFNENGDFLNPSKMDFGDSATQQEINQFLNPGANSRVSDHLFLNTKSRIDGNILREDDQFVYLADDRASNKISKNSILVIIYKDGHQTLFGQVENVAEFLWNVRDSLNTSYVFFKEDTARLVSSVPPKNNQDIKEVNMDIPTAAPNELNKNIKTILPDSSRPLTFEEVAGDLSKDAFEKKSLQKINQLNTYLKILCNKSSTYEEINKTIDQAVSLFVDENAMIETSSISRNDVKRYKIRTYLSRLKLVQYDKIEIEWTNVQYVSDVKRGPDGNFYGVVSFEQVFRGYRDGKLVYQDITRKNATVVLKIYEKNTEGNITNVWDVLLSDIGVITTKSI